VVVVVAVVVVLAVAVRQWQWQYGSIITAAVVLSVSGAALRALTGIFVKTVATHRVLRHTPLASQFNISCNTLRSSV